MYHYKGTFNIQSFEVKMSIFWAMLNEMAWIFQIQFCFLVFFNFSPWWIYKGRRDETESTFLTTATCPTHFEFEYFRILTYREAKESFS
jgi:hypothetical protein